MIQCEQKREKQMIKTPKEILVYHYDKFVLWYIVIEFCTEFNNLVDEKTHDIYLE